MTAAEPLKSVPLWVIWYWFFIFTSWEFSKVPNCQNAVTWYFYPMETIFQRSFHFWPEDHTAEGGMRVLMCDWWHSNSILRFLFLLISKDSRCKKLRLRLVQDLRLAIWTFPGLPTDSDSIINSEIQEMFQSLIIFAKAF